MLPGVRPHRRHGQGVAGFWCLPDLCGARLNVISALVPFDTFPSLSAMGADVNPVVDIDIGFRIDREEATATVAPHWSCIVCSVPYRCFFPGTHELKSAIDLACHARSRKNITQGYLAKFPENHSPAIKISRRFDLSRKLCINMSTCLHNVISSGWIWMPASSR